MRRLCLRVPVIVHELWVAFVAEQEMISPEVLMYTTFFVISQTVAFKVNADYIAISCLTGTLCC